MNQTKRSKNNQSTMSRSFQVDRDESSFRQTARMGLNAKIANLGDRYERYKKTQKLVMSELNMKKINTSLTLQEVSSKSFRARQRIDDLYVNYQANPFSISKPETEETIYLRETNRVKEENGQVEVKKDRTLVEALNNKGSNINRTKFNQLKPADKAELGNLHKREQASRQKMLLGKYTRSKSPLTQRAKREDGTRSRSPSPSPLGLFTPASVQDSLLDLDGIVNISEQSYFTKKTKEKDINIFNLLHIDKTSPLIMGGADLLKQQKFCSNSVIRTNERSIATHAEMISTEARLLVSDPKRIPSVDQADKRKFQIDMDNIGFEEILEVAQGRIHPDMLRHDAKANLEEEQEVSARGVLVYKFNHENVGISGTKQNDELSKGEINYFKKQAKTTREQTQHKLSQDCKRQLQKILQMQQTSKINTVNDQNLNEKFNAQKQSILLNQMDLTLAQDNPDTQKKIRMNKTRKDRCESIKTKMVLATMISKKVYEQSWKERSKSKNRIDHQR